MVFLGVEELEFEVVFKEREVDIIFGFLIFEIEVNESLVRCFLVEIIDLYERNVFIEDFMYYSNVLYDFFLVFKLIFILLN